MFKLKHDFFNSFSKSLSNRLITKHVNFVPYEQKFTFFRCEKIENRNFDNNRLKLLHKTLNLVRIYILVTSHIYIYICAYILNIYIKFSSFLNSTFSNISVMNEKLVEKPVEVLRTTQSNFFFNCFKERVYEDQFNKYW